MINAMIEIGYDAMTIGNHEFDFGHENLSSLKTEFHGIDLLMLSNNVIKDGSEMFQRYEVIEKDGHKVGIIGVTTPETVTKTHPNNTVGISFTEPLTEVKKDLIALEAESDLDLVIVLAHLGSDKETKDSERGDILANNLSALNYGIPIVVIDGHSHTAVNPSKIIGNNVLYAQTGEYIDNIGHIEVNKNDFTKSKGFLVATDSLEVPKETTDILDAETEAKADYDVIAGEVIVENFPLNLISDRKYSRTQETALGNLIADATMAYGKGFVKKPDLTVINGGGIRADLNEGKITKGDIIAVLPFGNMYSSIDVTGQQLIDMFEHSLRTPMELDENGDYIQNENGTYLLGQNGGFLHVSGARIDYSPFNEPGSRVLGLFIEVDDGQYEEVDPKGNYVLGTNDFLAFGGDGYNMLGGERLEGAGLEEVLIEFLSAKARFVDLDKYKVQFPTTRIVQQTFSDATVSSINELLEELNDVDETLYTESSYKAFAAAYAALEAYLDNEMLLEHELLALIDDLDAAYAGLEEVEVVVPKEPKPEPKPEPTPEPEAPKTPETDKLPATGSVSLAYPAIALLGVGLIISLISRRKE